MTLNVERGSESCVQPRSAEAAALHLNDDKSRSFEDTGRRLGYIRGARGWFNDPLTARQADAGQTSASPRSIERERRKEGNGARLAAASRGTVD